MKVIAFNGSGRKDGNTAQLLQVVMDELEKENIETELIQLAGKRLEGCIACYKCFQNKDKQCAIDSDDLNDKKGRDGKVKHDLHYTKDGYKVLGQRFADKAIELVKKSK